MPLGYAGTIHSCNLSMLQDLGLQRTMANGVLILGKNGRYASQAIGGTLRRPKTIIIPLNPWAAQYKTWLLINLTPKGLVFAFLSA